MVGTGISTAVLRQRERDEMDGRKKEKEEEEDEGGKRNSRKWSTTDSTFNIGSVEEKDC